MLNANDPMRAMMSCGAGKGCKWPLPGAPPPPWLGAISATATMAPNDWFQMLR
jgi:hypothetical protein